MFLNLSLLGPPQMSLNEQSVTHFHFDRVRALLFYLVVEASTVHDRTALTYLLWPDLPAQSGLQNLRQALAALRRVLRENQNKTPFLEVTAKTISFNSQAAFFLDYAAFNEHLEIVRRHHHRRLGACPVCMKRLQDAVDLYRGEFLANFGVESAPFEEWMMIKRERAHLQVLEALSELTDHHLRCHNPAKAIALAQRQLALDSLIDVGHHQLMQALVANDRRNAALIHYERYRKLLSKELGVSPPRKTLDLYKQIAGNTWQDVTPMPPHNLPSSIVPFIGYEAELTYIAERLATSDSRLLTLTGPGGSGKTSLALQAAWMETPHFKDGVFFVNLNQAKPGQLQEIIASTLPIPLAERVVMPSHPWAWLRSRELLLVLDHFDNLIGQASFLLRLLQLAPNLSILVTSREWLKLRGETVLMVRGLDCPVEADVEQVEQFSAVRFFIECARRLAPDFSLDTPADRQAAIQLCRLSGGLPLALQLAASWINIFSLPQIVLQINRNLDFLTSPIHNLPQQQRSMIAVFLSAWRQLSPQEQQAFCRLSVFPSGFTVEAAQVIARAAPSVLLVLQTKSLLHNVIPEKQRQSHLTTGQSGRFEIPELFRRFGVENLQQHSNLAPKMQYMRHSRYYLDLLHRQIERFASGEESHFLAAIRIELENIRQAWQWVINQQDFPRIAQAQSDLVRFYTAVGEYEEATRIFDQAMESLAAAGLQNTSPRPTEPN